MPEPTTIIAAKSIEAVGKTADGLIQRLLGPAADEIGEILRDKVKAYRAKNLSAALEITYTILSNSGVEIQAVPTRLLLPIIDGASLEDCEALTAKWAGLLATAATAKDTTSMHPSFPKILSEISALEAALLDSLWNENGETPWHDFRTRAMKEHNCVKDVIDACHGNLFRLGLWRTVSPKAKGLVVQFSPFGRTFMRATHGTTAAA